MDRYFYRVEKDVVENKIIHLFGNVYFNDADETETDYRHAEWTFYYLRLPIIKALFERDCFYEVINECVDYLGDITKDEANEICKTYFDGDPGTRLHIKDVTENTPCGNYWFEEE